MAKEAAYGKALMAVKHGQTFLQKKDCRKVLWGIVGIAVSPSNPDKVFALVENQNGGLLYQ